MRKLFTSVAAAILVSACSSVPVTTDIAVDRDPEHRPPDPQSVEHKTSLGQPIAIVAANVDVDERTRVLFNQALEAMAESKTTVATALLLEITEREPELAGSWVNLSILAEQQNDSVSADQYLAIALEKNPNNCDALVRRGIQYRQVGDFSAAESSYQRCLENNPGHSLANLNLGILYELYMGRYSEALALYHEYQLAVVEPSPRVNIWITDLERRVAALAKHQDAAVAKR